MSKRNKDIQLGHLASENGLVDTKQLSLMTTISPKQIKRMREKGLPFLQIGKLVRLHPDTVVKWLINEYQSEEILNNHNDNVDELQGDEKNNHENDGDNDLCLFS